MLVKVQKPNFNSIYALNDLSLMQWERLRKAGKRSPIKGKLGKLSKR